MIDHDAMQVALRARLVTLSVVTTGSINLSATGDTYVRPSGSFIDDGFYAGMEITGSGFDEAANEVATVILEVNALTLQVDQTLTTETDGAGKTLTAGLPSQRAWENVKFDPTSGDPYIEEEFIPGPSSQITMGDENVSTIKETTPQYRITVKVPFNVGTGALNKYVDSIIALFGHGTPITLSNGDVLRVRADTGPYRGQVLQREPGWASAPVTIPMRLYTT